MGCCFKTVKIDEKKYKESEDFPTHRIESILLNSEEFISGLSSCTSDTWVLSQESTLSLYKDFSFSLSWESSEHIRSISSNSSLICCGNKSIEVFSHQGKLQSKLVGHDRAINSLSIQNNLLLSGGCDWSLRLWDIFSQKELRKNLINWNVITCIKWADSNTAVQTSEDLRLRIWDIRDNNIEKGSVISVGDNFATCCDVKENYVVTGHRGFSNDGCDVKLWDIRKKECIFISKEHQEAVEGVLFHNEFVISCAKDGKISKIDYNGKTVETWKHNNNKPFVCIEKYKEGVLAANVEPKIMFFNVQPLVYEF